ncbi:MAG: MBL fold metallo-hydrolase [Planctomycetes bacterium]|nr:MBL fold metallo-hydrolase [Planctomycetota bacterium]
MTERAPLKLGPDGAGEEGAVTLRFIGAAQTTTGSLHRLRTEEGDLILDCGLYQGHREEAEAWNRQLPVRADRVRAVVLSHAHVDHCGSLPLLVKRGFRGPIWTTPATADLLPIMLFDSAHLQAGDIERVNRKLPANQQKTPLYTEEDVEATMRLVRTARYGEHFEPMKRVEGRFVDAGHILGSSAVHLTVGTRDGRKTTVGFTGDLGRTDVPLLRDPEPLGDVDWYLSESTYGDREHEDESGVEKHLRDVVVSTVARGGKLLIPAFAVGRTQLLVYLLHQLRYRHEIPDVPIYVDSPMARKATDVFRNHKDLYDGDARQFLSCCGPLFDAARTSYVEDRTESQALNRVEGPAIIISSSGMLEGGRMVHHGMHHGGDPRNTLLFVGYQAEHTLGRRLLDGAKEYRAFGEEHILRAKIEEISGLSAHADRRGLLAYVKKLDRPPQRTFLVHGEPEKIDALKGYLAASGLTGVTGPAPGDWFKLL